MSNINANVVVDPITLTVTDAPTTLTSTVDAINLGIYTSQAPESQPGGNIGQLQYNLNDILFAGVANSNIDANGNLVFTNLSNLKILGGSANYQLTTDGTGNLSWTDSITNANFANYAGNVTVSSQPNITSLGNLTSLTVNGNASISGAVDVGSLVVNGTSNLGPESNLTITGGTNGYVLGTDGAGVLSWVAQGGAGNGNPGGANTQIQFNDAGLFGGNTGFTFDKVTGNVALPGNLALSGNLDAGGNANIVNIDSNIVNVAVFANITGNLGVTGTTSIQQAQEKAKVNNVGSTGTINFDLLDQALFIDTANATGNFTLNFRGNSTTSLDSIMNANQSMTCTYINTNGAAPYFLSNASIDGNIQTVEYYNNNVPVIGEINGRNFYTFNIIKTAGNTFLVFGATGNIV